MSDGTAVLSVNLLTGIFIYQIESLGSHPTGNDDTGTTLSTATTLLVSTTTSISDKTTITSTDPFSTTTSIPIEGDTTATSDDNNNNEEDHRTENSGLSDGAIAGM